MQSNSARNSDPVRARPVRYGGQTKQERKVQTRKFIYRVGYSWNKGGRLKELRIRHLARKFLKIWMKNTFGRILPHEARSHYYSVTLRRTFEGWKDEWWVSRREWSLTMRAECHYRYYLCNRTLQSWRHFVSLQKEKRTKLQSAQSLADRRLMRLVWDGWERFIEMRRMHSKVLESALAQKRLPTIHSAWSLWQTRLQQQRDLYTLEDQALKHRALSSQRKAWVLWKEMHRAACCQREKESEAALHLNLRLKRRAFHQWKSHVSCHQAKKRTQALAQHAYCLRLVRKCWSKWSDALDRRRSEETRLQAAGRLAVLSTQRRALVCWKAYVKQCREEAERNQMASQHFRHNLMRAGLEGLSLNVIWNKTRRMNNNVAVQHYQQTILSKCWKLWMDRLEEAEDQSFQPLTGMALNTYRISLLRSCFYHWREKLAQQRHMQELEHCADVWFEERMLPICVKSWVEFTLQRRLREHRRHKAEVFNRQRRYTWVFYTWWTQSEKRKEEMLSERMAVVHEEKCHLQRAWAQWRRRTQQKIKEAEEQEASHRLYLHRLLHSTMIQWKYNSNEIRDRRNREQQACHQGDLRCMRMAVDKWKKFVQRQRVKKSRLKEIQRYHEVKLLKHSCVAWKKHHLQMSLIEERAEELYRRQTQCFLGKVFIVWREKAALLVEVRVAERQAQSHFQHILQLKVFLEWRATTTRAVSKRHQQEEALSRAQRSINQVRLLRSFRQWRKRTREARRERMGTEKARRHHNSKLLSKTLTAWSKHHYQHQKNKVMKRQGILLLKLKLYQTYFEEWKMKLQHRWREAKKTERALWHWSLTLQAKVLYGWRLWVTEQRRKREQAARAAQAYRDHLLREGVTCILTYAARMNDLTTSLTQLGQGQRSQPLQRAVRRCAMRWKQRALCKPRKEQEGQAQPPKKSVTFCFTEPGLNSVSSSDSVQQAAEGGALSKQLSTRMPRCQPRSRKERFESPLEALPHKDTLKDSDLTGIEAPPKCFELRCPSHTPSEPQMSTVDSYLEAQNQDLLLPPSAFMTSAPSENRLRGSSGKTANPHVEEASTDPASALTRELLSIQQEMKSFQQSRQQLRGWRKLREVLQSWLQTSGEDEQLEKHAVCEELKELEERIHRLSTELEKRRPTMLLHAERIQHLQSVLHTSGVSSFC
ncbi:uncharacterized protein sfi1 [Odontesthes bonariensis]|uniref:uncharacterized protein sfi1 n=1 Tax=Odontesthes bonariensis TaxID=219752 RepID=UPI003F58166C